MQVGDKNFRVWRGRDQLAVDCDRVAASVVASLAGVDRPLFLCMLSGAFVFAADLLRRGRFLAKMRQEVYAALPE